MSGKKCLKSGEIYDYDCEKLELTVLRAFSAGLNVRFFVVIVIILRFMLPSINLQMKIKSVRAYPNIAIMYKHDKSEKDVNGKLGHTVVSNCIQSRASV